MDLIISSFTDLLLRELYSSVIQYNRKCLACAEKLTNRQLDLEPQKEKTRQSATASSLQMCNLAATPGESW